MGSRPGILLQMLCPAPEATLLYRCGLVRPKVFMHIHAVAAAFINNQSHLVNVTRDRTMACKFSSQVCCGDFALTHRHVTQLRPAEVYAIANRVNSIDSVDAHSRIDIYV